MTTTASEAVVRWNDLVVGLVAHRADTPARLEHALASDAGLAVAHCVRGFAAKLLARRDLVPVAVAARDAAMASLAERGGSARERLIVDALGAWCAGDPLGAVAALESVLALHPRDLVAIKLSHALQFMLGLPAGMRRSVERVLPAWDESVPGFAFVLGCHAFTLEEAGELEQAEAVGRRAHELDGRDVWGAHAVAHVLETQDRAREGLAWMRRIDMGGVNNFAGHLAWHSALFHLGLGDTDAALSLYDDRIATHLARDYRDVANTSTLLWRLEHEGVDVGDRWERLAEIARARIGDHALGFADVHHVLSLVGAGDISRAREMVGSMRAFTTSRTGIEASVIEEVAAPVAEAIIELAEGPPERAVARLIELRQRFTRLGGSHVQRDVLDLVLIDAALRSRDRSTADQLLAERLARRPQDWWGRARTSVGGGEDARAVA